MFGFWSGTAVDLAPVCIAKICTIEELGKRNGIIFAMSNFGALIGIPIAVAILNNSSTNYFGLVMFGGCLYVAGAIAFDVARDMEGGWALRVFY